MFYLPILIAAGGIAKVLLDKRHSKESLEVLDQVKKLVAKTVENGKMVDGDDLANRVVDIVARATSEPTTHPIVNLLTLGFDLSRLFVNVLPIWAQTALKLPTYIITKPLKWLFPDRYPRLSWDTVKQQIWSSLWLPTLTIFLALVLTDYLVKTQEILEVDKMSGTTVLKRLIVVNLVVRKIEVRNNSLLLLLIRVLIFFTLCNLISSGLATSSLLLSQPRL